MQFSYKNNILKIDNGDHYYTTDIKQEMFPEEIRDNFEEIIEQSFINYSDTTYNVTHEFNNFNNENNNFNKENNIFTIFFNYLQKPFSFKRIIEFKMNYHMKDFKDYTNERIEKLESTIGKLESTIEELKVMFTVKKDEPTINDEEEDEEDDDDEDSEEQVEVQLPVTKGGKKVTAVVQMRGGRQVVSKK